MNTMSKKLYKNCLVCKKKFEQKPYESKNYFLSKKYCSRQCFGCSCKKQIPEEKIRYDYVIGEMTLKEIGDKYEMSTSHISDLLRDFDIKTRRINDSDKWKQRISEKNKGMKRSEEIKKEIRLRMIGKRTGSENNFWKDGISKMKGYKSFIQKRRELRKKKNGGKFSFNKWVLLKNKYDNRCLCCGKKEPEIKLTIDHIIPISKGGMDCVENTQPLCMLCNQRKHDKTINYLQAFFKFVKNETL